MARWRSRHFMAVKALGPQEVELEHSKVVVSWLLQFHVLFIGGPKGLSISKNHPKPSQEFSEQLGPSIHKMKGSSKNSPQKSELIFG